MNKRLKLVVSDFHLSRGPFLPDGRRNPLEDFHQDDKFEEFLDHYSSGEYLDADVELIINGDFFDPLAVIPMLSERRRHRRPEREFPIEIEENAAVRQFQKIFEGHPRVMNQLRVFLRRGKKIVFRWGNHDAAILWPKIQEMIREKLQPPQPEQLTFQIKPYIFDGICIDHGHQYEIINQFDESALFIERKTRHGTKTLMNLPFGSFFVMGFINRIKLKRHYINQVHPFRVYLRMTFFLDPLWFWLGGLQLALFFIKMRFITHPMRFARFKKTILIVLEAMRRTSLEKVAEKILLGPGSLGLPYSTIIMGHNHQAKVRVFRGGKLYVNTGTWTPITSLHWGSLGHQVVRTYAIIDYQETGAPHISLKVWNGTPRVIEDYQ